MEKCKTRLPLLVETVIAVSGMYVIMELGCYPMKEWKDKGFDVSVWETERREV